MSRKRTVLNNIGKINKNINKQKRNKIGQKTRQHDILFHKKIGKNTKKQERKLDNRTFCF